MQNRIFQIPVMISRNLVRSYARKKVANPGVQKRINILEERDESNLLNVDVEELESNFMKLNEVHLQHETEQKNRKEKEKYWIVRRKYFKENKINFLTWSDKEQIRYLYQSDPHEWTKEKLSDGFPALPNTISKIIKGKWQKSTESKKENHDKAVERHWKLLNEDKLSDELPADVIAHVLKFSTRKRETITPTKFVINATDTGVQKKVGEFSTIINSYKQLRNKTNTESNAIEKISINENFLRGKTTTTVNNQHITLSKLKENIAEKIESGNSVNKQDEMILEKLSSEEYSTECRSVTNENLNKIIQNKHVKNKLITSDKQNANELVVYPEKISIPKEKFMKGSTYKVNDCYYDDDGEFLYRVPGMY